jgi:uncharacterized glyoxalase superfamily protein PhnB
LAAPANVPPVSSVCARETLGATGKVIEPILDTPWGGLFGVVQEEFGIHWMVNSDAASTWV